MHTGEMPGSSLQKEQNSDGKYKNIHVHCRVNLELKEIEQEESSVKRATRNSYDFKGKKEEILTKHLRKSCNRSAADYWKAPRNGRSR